MKLQLKEKGNFFSLFLYLWFNHENLADQKQFWAQIRILSALCSQSQTLVLKKSFIKVLPSRRWTWPGIAHLTQVRSGWWLPIVVTRPHFICINGGNVVVVVVTTLFKIHTDKDVALFLFSLYLNREAGHTWVHLHYAALCVFVLLLAEWHRAAQTVTELFPWAFQEVNLNASQCVKH